MKERKDSAVATISAAPEITTKSLRDVLRACREESEHEIDQLDSTLQSWRDRKEAIPKVLLTLHFLMDWCTDGVNNDLPGEVSSGLSYIIHRCAYETAKRFAEWNELLDHSDLEQKVEVDSKSASEASSQTAS